MSLANIKLSFDCSKSISICICTFCRPLSLKNLLNHLVVQCKEIPFDIEIIIVDNDARQSALAIVSHFIKTSPIKIYYYNEPVQNISLARNIAVKLSHHNLIVFIDDDEFPSPDWLKNLLAFYQKNQCDGILGPVKPYYQAPPPSWITKSGILERPDHKTGEMIRPEDMRTGNALVRRALFFEDEFPFDPKYGTIGGGDVEFFLRMVKKGYNFLWCQEAVVYEIIPLDRQTLEYQLKRALCRGKSRSMMTPFISFPNLKSLMAILLYFSILPLTFLAGLGTFNKYLIKFFDHIGKLSAYLGLNPIKNRPYKPR